MQYLRPSAGADIEAELRGSCEQHVGCYKTPELIRFFAELSRGPSGKVQRLKLVEAGA